MRRPPATTTARAARGPCVQARRARRRPARRPREPRPRCGERPGPRPRPAPARRAPRRRAGRGAQRAVPGSSAGPRLPRRFRLPSRPSPPRTAGCHRRPPGSGCEDPARRPPRARRRAGRLVRRERLEQRGRCIQLAAAPGGSHVEQLGPCHAQQQDRSVPAEIGDVLDEVEERRLAPVQVVEDDDDRPLGGASLEQLAEGPGDLLRRARGCLVTEDRRKWTRSSRRPAPAA